MTPYAIELIFNLLVHLCVLWWFLTSFFFLYVRHIESSKIYEQLDDYIGQQVRTTLARTRSEHPWNNPNWMYMLEHSSDEDLDAFERNLEKAMEADVILANERVQTRAIAIGIAFTGLVLFFYAWFRDSIQLGHVLTENMMVFALIGGFEYLFFTRYGLHYEPVDPNEMLLVVRRYKASKLGEGKAKK